MVPVIILHGMDSLLIYRSEGNPSVGLSEPAWKRLHAAFTG